MLTERDIVRALERADVPAYDLDKALQQAFADAAIEERGAE